MTPTRSSLGIAQGLVPKSYVSTFSLQTNMMHWAWSNRLICHLLFQKWTDPGLLGCCFGSLLDFYSKSEGEWILIQLTGWCWGGADISIVFFIKRNCVHRRPGDYVPASIKQSFTCHWALSPFWKHHKRQTHQLKEFTSISPTRLMTGNIKSGNIWIFVCLLFLS